jgi:maltodextrin utilization protein YvdJ
MGNFCEFVAAWLRGFKASNFIFKRQVNGCLIIFVGLEIVSGKSLFLYMTPRNRLSSHPYQN